MSFATWPLGIARTSGLLQIGVFRISRTSSLHSWIPAVRDAKYSVGAKRSAAVVQRRFGTNHGRVMVGLSRVSMRKPNPIWVSWRVVPACPTATHLLPEAPMDLPRREEQRRRGRSTGNHQGVRWQPAKM